MPVPTVTRPTTANPTVLRGSLAAGQSGVIQQERRFPGSFPKEFDRRKPVPRLRQIWEKLDYAFGDVHKTWHTDANGTCFSLRFFRKTINQLGYALECICGSGCRVGVYLFACEDVPLTVTENQGDLGAPEVNAGTECGGAYAGRVQFLIDHGASCTVAKPEVYYNSPRTEKNKLR
jgi:hypothetical protein